MGAYTYHAEAMRLVGLLAYITQVMEEAAAVEASNLGDGPEASDQELVAQMEHVVASLERNDIVVALNAADHLRGMLLISYLDEEDVPTRSDGPPIAMVRW